MSKTYTLVQNGTRKEYGSKKTAVKYGEMNSEPFQVLSPSGQVVHEGNEPVSTESPVAEEPVSPELGEQAVAENEKTAPKYEEVRDFPGNYSIVMVPFVAELADAYGEGQITVREEKVTGKLNRLAHIGSDTKFVLTQFLTFLDEKVAEVQPALREWQKENADRRRSLTDMQKYLEHREFITAYGKRAADEIRKQAKS